MNMHWQGRALCSAALVMHAQQLQDGMLTGMVRQHWQLQVRDVWIAAVIIMLLTALRK